MLHAYLDESGTHDSEATAVIAAIATPEVWGRFDELWGIFLHDLDLERWHHRDFDKRRNNYGVWTDEQWASARDRLCKILIESAIVVVGAGVGRETYQEVKAKGKWRLPNDPYEFCLERCLEQVTKRVYSAPPDNGVNIFYDNQKQFGRITGRLLRWHKKTFEPNRLSEFRQRQIDLQFIPSSRDAPGFAVPDILAFECCEYLRANTGIPFLGAKLMSGPTPEPRPIVTKFFESKRVALAVVKTYTEWFLDFDLSNDAAV